MGGTIGKKTKVLHAWQTTYNKSICTSTGMQMNHSHNLTTFSSIQLSKKSTFHDMYDMIWWNKFFKLYRTHVQTRINISKCVSVNNWKIDHRTSIIPLTCREWVWLWLEFNECVIISPSQTQTLVYVFVLFLLHHQEFAYFNFIDIITIWYMLFSRVVVTSKTVYFIH